MKVKTIIRYHYMSTGEGNVNPLQYSCLGNPMDRAWAWWATALGVVKSQTQLSNWAHTHTRWLKDKKKKRRKKDCQGCGVSVILNTQLVGNVKFSFFLQTKTITCHTTQYPTPRHLPKWLDNLWSQKTCTWMFIAASFIIAKLWKQTRCLSTS